MRKNTQTIACYILIPMLIFTFVITVSSEKLSINDSSKNVIYQYFSYRNNKDIESIEKLLVNKEDLNIIQADSKYLQNIKIISAKEEKNESLKKVYIKNADNISEKNVKVFKVKYEVTYDPKSKYYNKSGTYECWYFLNNINGEWLIDTGEI